MLREDLDKKHLEEAQSFGASIYFAICMCMAFAPSSNLFLVKSQLMRKEGGENARDKSLQKPIHNKKPHKVSEETITRNGRKNIHSSILITN